MSLPNQKELEKQVRKSQRILEQKQKKQDKEKIDKRRKKLIKDIDELEDDIKFRELTKTQVLIRTGGVRSKRVIQLEGMIVKRILKLGNKKDE